MEGKLSRRIIFTYDNVAISRLFLRIPARQQNIHLRPRLKGQFINRTFLKPRQGYLQFPFQTQPGDIRLRALLQSSGNGRISNSFFLLLK